MSDVVYVLQFTTWIMAAAFVLLMTLRVTRLLVRRRRIALRDEVARPLIDGARLDAAIHGLHLASSEDVSRAIEADAAGRGQRTSLVLDIDPLAGNSKTSTR